jgi:LPS O-antigen subunit length determinant protein (WzzB/FepE family)
MWKDKKFIIISGLLVVLIALGATLGGIALSRQNDNIVRLPQVSIVLPEQAGNILQNISLTPEERQERMNEALDNYLQKLVDEGKITQEEADQYKAWWESRPDISGLFSNLLPDFTRIFSFTHIK